MTVYDVYKGTVEYEGAPPIPLWKMVAVFLAILGTGSAGYAVTRRRKQSE